MNLGGSALSIHKIFAQVHFHGHSLSPRFHFPGGLHHDSVEVEYLLVVMTSSTHRQQILIDDRHLARGVFDSAKVGMGLVVVR